MRTLPSSVSLTAFWNAPSALLLFAGTLIGLNFPLGKLGGQAGVSPMLWALLISAGATLTLLPLMLLKRQLRWPSAHVIRYTVISSSISFVGPNVLVFSVIPHVGAGYTGLMFALSPVFTVLFASLFGIRTPGRLGLIGIGVGLVGAVVVSLTRGAQPAGPAMHWLLAALLIPVGLASGNVYRTLDWPGQTPPNTLAFWGQVYASALLMAMLWLTHGAIPLGELAPAAGVAMLQMLVAGMTFPVTFQLQRRGGPVLLSQMGYVAAAVGLLVATFALGERYAPATWAGAGIIGLGIAITIVARRGEGGGATDRVAAGSRA